MWVCSHPQVGVVNMVVLVVMGVCGCGKSTVGRGLADQFSVPFCDADDHHPPCNVDKMAKGIPLLDEDRFPWLNKLHTQLVHWETSNDTVSGDCVRGVLACSALKKSYRDILTGIGDPTSNLIGRVLFIYLQGSPELIRQRMLLREDHFMPPSLLQSQFSDLEEPQRSCVTVDITGSVGELLDRVKGQVDVYLER